jgi:hypothetical protein
MLRLKGETDDAVPDEAPRGGLEEQDQITPRDAFPDDETDSVAEDPRWRLPRLPLRGLAVATATFVPTFLLIFFGLPYLLAPDGPIHAAIATVRSASEAPSTPAPSTPPPVARPEPARSSNPGRPSVEPPAAPVPAPEPPKKAEEPMPSVASQAPPPPAPSSRSARAERAPALPEPSAREAAREPSPPALPPARRSAPEPRSNREARAATEREEQRTVEAKPAGREGRDWTPAAAFTDRAAANRLASSIEKQGYPVEIRQDGSSTRPWVVWIGAQPSGGSRRR